MSAVNFGCGERVTVGDDFCIRGKRLRERRNLLGMTQEEAAGNAGVDASYWSQLENNKAKNPGLGTLRRVAQAVQTSVSYLIGETDDPRPIVTDNEPLHNSDYWDGGSGSLEAEDYLILERAFLEVMTRRRRRREKDAKATDE